MWAALSFPLKPSPSLPVFGISPTNLFNPKPLKLTRASFFDFPLASRIMVRNLPFSISESFLIKEFSKFGQIAEVNLVKDEAKKRSKGYAFIQYTCQDDAMLALETMDCQNFDGRMICVEFAKPTNKEFGKSPKTSGPPDGE